MAIKKRGLGRGLDALLSGSRPTDTDSVSDAESASAIAPSAPAEPPGERLRQLPVDLIQRGRYQPRTDMHQDRLQELAESIRAQGIIQPVVVRPLAEGRFELLAGERRWRAAQIAGLHEIPAVIKEVPDQAALALSLIENIQRENLNPLEEALAFHRLLTEFELTHQQVADAVGKSRTSVTNLLRLLDLNDDVKRLLENGDLEMGHARALLALKGKDQSQAAEQVVERGLNVRETEALVRKLQEEPKAAAVKPPEDPNVRRLQQDLSERIGARVTIRQGGKGKGKLQIEYNSLDELEGILAHIR